MRVFAFFPVVLVLGVLLAPAIGCDGRSEQRTATERAPAQSAAPGSQVARIVFIDQEEACECDRNRINGSWAALQAALGDDSGIEVVRIHRDIQEQEAEEYRLLRPMVTVPGVYLLDEGGAIIELLQGEITEAQLRGALGERS